MLHDDSKLIEFALEQLSQDERAAVLRELAESSAVQQDLRTIETVLGDLALTVEPMQPRPQTRDRLLAALEPANRFEGFVKRLARFFDMGLEQTRRLLTVLDSRQDNAWIATVPGIYQFQVAAGPRLAGAQCALVRLEPGYLMPAHRHLGDEWGFILQGRAEENSGRTYDPGDMVHSLPGSSHWFWTVGEEPFVFAVALYGGVEWGVS